MAVGTVDAISGERIPDHTAKRNLVAFAALN